MSDIPHLQVHSEDVSHVSYRTFAKVHSEYMSEILLLPVHTDHVLNLTCAKVHPEDILPVRNPTFAKVHSEYVLHVRNPTFARTLRRCCTCQKSYFCQSGTGSGGQTVAWCPQ